MPTLLFIHGHPFDRSMWQPQIDHFTAKGWRVLAPDLRGYGAAPLTPSTGSIPATPRAGTTPATAATPATPTHAAPATPGMVTLPEFAADLIALLDAERTRAVREDVEDSGPRRSHGGSAPSDLGAITPGTRSHANNNLGAIHGNTSGRLGAMPLEPVVVCGLSMGGQIAMELVHSYPERFAGLILADTSPAAETAQGKVNRRRIADRITADGMAAYAEELLPDMLAPSTIRNRPDLAAYVLDMMSRAPARGAAAALRGRAERRDYGATLLTLDLPTLVIVGTEDAFTTVGEAEATAKMLRDGRLVTIDDAGHMPNLEAPDAFNAAVDGFLPAAVRTTTLTGR